MAKKILIELDILRKKIQSGDFLKEVGSAQEWGGADVIIKNQLDKNTEEWLEGQPLTISLQNSEPRRRVVITEFSKELSWLFDQLRSIFSEKIDSISKYDFYGSIAQAALDYIDKDKEAVEQKKLLFTVLDESINFINDEDAK